MDKTIDDIIKRAQDIRRLAESEKNIGNLQTAENYFAIMHKLLNKHKLGLTDIEFDRHVDEPIGESPIYWRNHDLPFKRRRQAWLERLSSLVAEAYSCKILVSPGSNTITLVGHKSNREIAEYTLVILVRAVREEMRKSYRAYRREVKKQYGDTGDALEGYRMSFYWGFVSRIGQRLREFETETQQDSGERGLIRLRRELAVVAKHVNEKYKRSCSAIGGGGSYSGDGERAGRACADRMDLRGKAVGSNGGSRGQLE